VQAGDVGVVGEEGSAVGRRVDVGVGKSPVKLGDVREDMLHDAGDV
jgi:hypothetical protein